MEKREIDLTKYHWITNYSKDKWPEEWQKKEYLSGPPKETVCLTIEQLEEYGLIGVYAPNEEPEPPLPNE